MPDQSLGEAIRAARIARNRKMMAVHRFVSTSTINAIEHDRMCPSVSILDAISKGLEVPVGVWDELYLDRATEPREALVVCQRLLNRTDPPFFVIQRNLRRLARASTSRYPRVTAELLKTLAEVAWRQDKPRRALVLCKTVGLRARDQNWVDLEIEALATLGKWYLVRELPWAALPVLERTVTLPAVTGAWESAAHNLGVALWRLGRYEEAAVHWRGVQEKISQVGIQAHIAMGLGNVTLAQGRYCDALRYFERAFAIYRGSPHHSSFVIGALNNCLFASVMANDWESAEEWVREAVEWSHISDIYGWGEFASTRAEMAWKQGQAEDSKVYLRQAYEFLGQHLCRSWFTVRLLDAEIALSENEVARACQRFDEILSRVTQVHDIVLRMALVVRALDIALRAKPSIRKLLDLRIRRFQALNAHLY